MRAISAPDEIFITARNFRMDGQSIGLVPTMGALHEGHLALIKKSLEDNDITVVSIFVNPLQFNSHEDLINYPSSIEEDKAMLQSLEVDILFEPTKEKFYTLKPVVGISFGELETTLEGKHRPGHFAGVGIVVNKLLNLVQPDRAYFGLKDLQQYAIIRRMVEDLSMPVEIVGVETIRERSGLAMSSRNRRLSNEGLDIGSEIYKGLLFAEGELKKKRNPKDVKADLVSFYSDIHGLEVEYVEILDPVTFTSAQTVHHDEVAVCFAGYVEGVRLIDNLIFAPDRS